MEGERQANLASQPLSSKMRLGQARHPQRTAGGQPSNLQAEAEIRTGAGEGRGTELLMHFLSWPEQCARTLCLSVLTTVGDPP